MKTKNTQTRIINRILCIAAENGIRLSRNDTKRMTRDLLNQIRTEREIARSIFEGFVNRRWGIS